MTGWRSLVRGVAIAVYAVALLLAFVSLMSAAYILIADGPQPALIGMAAGSLAFAVVIGWRLQLNLRAAGWRMRSMPKEARLRATIWRGAVALVGWPVLLVGMAWTVTAVLVLSRRGTVFMADQAAFQPVVIGWGLFATGAIALAAGVAMQIPLARLFTRRPSAVEPPTDAASGG